MKWKYLILASVFCAGGWLWASSASERHTPTGPEKAPRDFMAGSQVWIEGNSSLHRYYFTVENISAKSDLTPSDLKLENLLAFILRRKGCQLTVTVPVKNMKSGNSELDRNAYEKLEAGKYPNILFRMENYVVKAFPGSLTTYALLVSGKLAIAGVEREVVLEPTLVVGKDGVKIYGSQDIYQKDYGISPYSVAVVMTTDNKVVVHYMIALGLK